MICLFTVMINILFEEKLMVLIARLILTMKLAIVEAQYIMESLYSDWNLIKFLSY